MERGEQSPPEKTRGRRRVLLSGVAVLLLLLVVAVVLGLALRRKPDEFKAIFIARCELLKGYNCPKIWSVFEGAYVGRDPCEVPMEAYDPLVATAPFKPSCNRMMFWSKTKEVVHDFTEKGNCYVTLEDTLLGKVLDGLTWCGKEGKSGTFTTDCPGWSDCENNPVKSFWKRVSTAFADVACGNVTAMLNGSIATPFSPTSIFGSIEVKGFESPRVRSLTVVLVTQKNTVTNCTNASFKDLQKELDSGIKYSCKEVAEAHLQNCSSHPEEPCGSCW